MTETSTRNMNTRLEEYEVVSNKAHLDENLWNLIIVLVLVPTGFYLGSGAGFIFMNACLGKK